MAAPHRSRLKRALHKKAALGSSADLTRLRAPARIKPAGLSLSSRFALATAFIIVLCIAVMTSITYRAVATALDKEIDDAGIQTVRALVVTDVRSWRPYYRTPVEGREEEFKEGIPSSLFTTDAQKSQFERQKQTNRNRAQSVARGGDTKLLDAVILDAERVRVINGQGPIKFRPAGGERVVGNVAIQTGIYEGAVTTAARSYGAPMLDADGRVEGYAVVVLSEDKIQRMLAEMLRYLALLAGAFIVVGVLVSWFLGSRITRPLAHLLEDMEAVARGDLEHKTGSHSSDEIGVLARTFDRMTQNLNAARHLQRKQAAQEHQIGIAREVQARLFPRELPRIAGFECATTPQPRSAAAADFYDLFALQEGRYLLAMVSSSGSDLAGSMIVLMARTLVKSLSSGESSPAEILRKVNHFLSPDLRPGMYVTALLAILDANTATIEFANAGHSPLVCCKSGQRVAAPLHSEGIALGFDSGPVFNRTIRDRSVELKVGDRLVLCAPSVFVVDEQSGDQLAEEQVLGILGRHSASSSESFVSQVMQTLAEMTGASRKERETAFLTIKRLG